MECPLWRAQGKSELGLAMISLEELLFNIVEGQIHSLSCIYVADHFFGSIKLFEVNKDIGLSCVDKRIKRSSYTSFKDSRTTTYSRLENSAFNL